MGSNRLKMKEKILELQAISDLNYAEIGLMMGVSRRRVQEWAEGSTGASSGSAEDADRLLERINRIIPKLVHEWLKDMGEI